MSFLDRSHTIAGPGFSRWLVPGGAVRAPVHRTGLRAQRVQPADDQAPRHPQSGPDDWKLTQIGWIFSIAIFFLGVSSALFGRWVEEAALAPRDVHRGAELGGADS